MGFDSRTVAKVITPRDGDGLDDIAAREQAAGNDITAEQIAKFNFGTKDPHEINEFLRDELGARKRDSRKNFVLAPDDNGRSQLLVPKRFTKEGLPTGRMHTLRVVSKNAPPQFLECCSIPGITFEFDKSFIRPTVVDTLKQLEEAKGRNPDAKIMIWGHTDKVGSESYNKLLSERRAKSVFAFITNDVNTWEQLAAHPNEQWGRNEDNQMLADQGFDPATNPNAVRDYQTARGLSPDGAVGPITRRQLFTDYMSGKHDLQLTADQFMDPKHMGCGEFNPQVETEAKEEKNRRVTFFLFHKDRLPVLPCPKTDGDTGPCKRQIAASGPRHVASFKCSFFDSIAFKCQCENPNPPPATKLSLTLVQVDPLFAPGVETLAIQYRIEDSASVLTTAKIEISSGTGAARVVEHTLTGVPFAAGTHNLTWDGKKADNTFISFPKSPYTVTVLASRDAAFTNPLKDEKPTRVELHSLQTLVRGDRIQRVGTETRVTFERNQRATPNAITQKADFIVEATLRFKNKTGGPVTTPIPVRIDWTYEDPVCDKARIANATALAYVNLALTFNQTKASTPPGDNCHKDLGGKRGDTAHQFFKAHTGFNLTADGNPAFHEKAKGDTADSGTFTARTIVDGQTLQTVATRHGIPVEDLTAANPALAGGPFPAGTNVTIPKRGKSILEFVTANIAGDNYIVVATVHDQTAMKTKTETVNVFRRVPVEIIQEMDGGGEHCTSGSNFIQPMYNPANSLFALPAVTNIAMQNPLWPHLPLFPRILRETFPPAPAQDAVYLNTIRNNSFNAEFQFEADIHAGTGIQLVGAHFLRLSGAPTFVNGVNAAGAAIRRNTGGENGQQEGGGFNTGTNRIIIYHAITFAAVSALVTHEMGHLLNLEHQTNTGGGAATPTDHDPAELAAAGGATGGCLMRGDAASDHFCGKCLLKLWGWTITALTGQSAGL